LLLTILNSLVALDLMHGVRRSWVVVGLDAVLFVVFLARARQRGEMYVKGLFWSYL